ncbi:MAG TPA: hypothetical protein ENI51_07900 [Candidatus Atribacteria bacterium]|nr:hypothetical protein [Candidatus Atribacteria bacterium]
MIDKKWIYDEYKDLDVSKEKITEGIEGFFNNFIDLRRIKAIEKALNAAHREFIKAIREQGTHLHKKNMLKTYLSLIQLLRNEIEGYNNYYLKYLAERYLERFKKNQELIDFIKEVILERDFTHWEQRLLLRPFLFPFEMECNIPWGSTYESIRKEIEEILRERYIELIKKGEIEETIIFDKRDNEMEVLENEM